MKSGFFESGGGMMVNLPVAGSLASLTIVDSSAASSQKIALSETIDGAAGGVMP